MLQCCRLTLAPAPATQPHAHLAPVGRGVQWLPAIKVLGAQTGPVFQQQGGRLGESIGSSDVQLQADARP